MKSQTNTAICDFAIKQKLSQQYNHMNTDIQQHTSIQHTHTNAYVFNTENSSAHNIIRNYKKENDAGAACEHVQE